MLLRKLDWCKIDIYSLRFRLTIGVAIVSIFGMGSLAGWTTWKIQQILIDSHKQKIHDISERLPRDLDIYMEMKPPREAIQKTVDKLTTNRTFVSIKTPPQGTVIKSSSWQSLPDAMSQELTTASYAAIKPEIVGIQDRYFVVCGGELKTSNANLGQLAIVQDITNEQKMFVGTLQSLVITSIALAVFLAIAIAVYIHRALQPLQQLQQTTANISVKDLATTQLTIENAPTEVSEITQAFNLMLTRLSQSWEQERQFVNDVSHELRTPLTIVQGYLQSVLRRPKNLTDLQKEALETAASEAERTISLLQDMLDLARADSGYLRLQMQPCILNDIVSEVVEMTQKCYDREIQIQATNTQIVANVDYQRLVQVLLNLIDNAIKYSPENEPIKIGLSSQNKIVQIQVYDFGEGISLQHQARIFERFYRVDEARNRAGGTGLGLAIVKTLVEAMKGSISVRSSNKGSVFTVSLPIVE